MREHADDEGVVVGWKQVAAAVGDVLVGQFVRSVVQPRTNDLFFGDLCALCNMMELHSTGLVR